LTLSLNIITLRILFTHYFNQSRHFYPFACLKDVTGRVKKAFFTKLKKSEDNGVRFVRHIRSTLSG